MPKACTACVHPDRAAIDRALVAGSATLRDIAEQFGLSKSTIFRHRTDHLPVHLARARDAAEVASADDLLRELGALRAKAVSLLIAAERAGDLRSALAGVREARGCLELLARLLGELRDGPEVTITVSPAWIELRAAIVGALAPYPDARLAVAGVLADVEAGVNDSA
jgi:hypothetical protein